MRNTKRFTSLAAVAMLGLLAAAPVAVTTSQHRPTPRQLAERTATGCNHRARRHHRTRRHHRATAPPPQPVLLLPAAARRSAWYTTSVAVATSRSTTPPLRGVERAKSELGITFTEASPNADGSNRKELLDLAAQSSDIVIAVGFLFEPDAAAVGKSNPDKTFGVVDSPMLDSRPTRSSRTATTSPVWSSPRSRARSSSVPQRR